MNNVKNFLEQYGKSKLDEMIKILNSAGKGDSNIIDSIDYEIEGDDIKFIFPDYAKWVDEGRGPGKQPPLKKISDWTSRKGLPEKAAFPIARKIGREGIEPTNFMDPIRDYADFIEGLEEATRKDIIENLQK